MSSNRNALQIKLADQIRAKFEISPEIYQAFCKIDRAEFVKIVRDAYTLNPQPISENQWISSPLTVAKMTQYLELAGADSVLEIGCGSGYQSAILSKIVRRVFAVERIEKLVDESKIHFKNLGILNVHVLHADGNFGWEKYAPYDRILISAAKESVSEKLFSQLRENGFLIAPIKFQNGQKIVKFQKRRLFIKEEILDDCEFVPLLNGKF